MTSIFQELFYWQQEHVYDKNGEFGTFESVPTVKQRHYQLNLPAMGTKRSNVTGTEGLTDWLAKDPAPQ